MLSDLGSCRWRRCARDGARLVIVVALLALPRGVGAQGSATREPPPAGQAHAPAPPAAPASWLGPAATAPKAAFELQSKDGRSTLVPSLAVQLRYQYLNKDGGAAGGREGDSYVEPRRIRPTMAGTILRDDLSYYFHLSTSYGSIELMDIYLNYRCLSLVELRLGQWKIPFTRFRIQSFKNLTFADWPITTTYFGAERQLGLALHNGGEKPPRFEYELGLFAGPNARASHAVALARVFGEPVPNPSDLAHPDPRASLHPELVAHLAYNSPRLDTSTDTDLEGGPLRFSAGASTAWDLDPVRTQDLALRLAPELLIKAYGFSFSGIFYLGFSRSGDGVADQRLAFVGGLVQGSYLCGQRVELALRYAVVETSADELAEARQRAAGIVAAAEDPTRQALLAAQYAKAGTVKREEEASCGVNVYLLGRTLKWQNDVSWLRHTLLAETRGDLRVRSQLQLAY